MASATATPKMTSEKKPHPRQQLHLYAYGSFNLENFQAPPCDRYFGSYTKGYSSLLIFTLLFSYEFTLQLTHSNHSQIYHTHCHPPTRSDASDPYLFDQSAHAQLHA